MVLPNPDIPYHADLSYVPTVQRRLLERKIQRYSASPGDRRDHILPDAARAVRYVASVWHIFRVADLYILCRKAIPEHLEGNKDGFCSGSYSSMASDHNSCPCMVRYIPV